MFSNGSLKKFYKTWRILITNIEYYLNKYTISKFSFTKKVNIKIVYLKSNLVAALLNCPLKTICLIKNKVILIQLLRSE